MLHKAMAPCAAAGSAGRPSGLELRGVCTCAQVLLCSRVRVQLCKQLPIIAVLYCIANAPLMTQTFKIPHVSKGPTRPSFDLAGAGRLPHLHGTGAATASTIPAAQTRTHT